MRRDIDETTQNMMKVAKRIVITALCCVPFLFIFTYLMRDYLTSRAGRIVLYIAVMAVAVLIEELIVRKREKVKKMRETIEEEHDVFK